VIFFYFYNNKSFPNDDGSSFEKFLMRPSTDGRGLI